MKYRKWTVISVCVSLINRQRADWWINLLHSVLMALSSSHACDFVGSYFLNTTGQSRIPHNKIKHFKSAYHWWWKRKKTSVLVSKDNSVIERKRKLWSVDCLFTDLSKTKHQKQRRTSNLKKRPPQSHICIPKGVLPPQLTSLSRFIESQINWITKDCCLYQQIILIF